MSADKTETLPHRSTPSCDMLRLIHMATESGQSESGPFVIDDYFL